MIFGHESHQLCNRVTATQYMHKPTNICPSPVSRLAYTSKYDSAEISPKDVGMGPNREQVTYVYADCETAHVKLSFSPYLSVDYRAYWARLQPLNVREIAEYDLVIGKMYRYYCPIITRLKFSPVRLFFPRYNSDNTVKLPNEEGMHPGATTNLFHGQK